MKIKLIAQLNILLMLIILSTAFAQTPKKLRGDRLFRRLATMDGNLIQTIFKNYGEICDYPNEPSCNWPSFGKHYCDGVAVIVSAEVENSLGKYVHPLETQYREDVDKSPEDIPWGFEPRPYWFNMDEKENKAPAMSNNSITWPAHWLDKPSSWDGYWNGYFGKGIFNADLETVFVFDDDPDKEPNLKMNYYCDENDSTRGGLGLWVKARGFQWSQVLAEDCIFWIYNITNESSHNYYKVFYAQYIDWGVGGVEDNADDIGEYDTNLDIAFAYDTDGYGSPGNWIVGYAGYAFLESPGISNDDKDNDNDGLIDEKRYNEPGEYIFGPVGIYGEPKWHWEGDEDGDWVPYTDFNSNGICDLSYPQISMNGDTTWIFGEPLNDDLGKDGVGPYDLHYNGPDEGEGDDKPTNGEPNYNETDPDESDQLGLTGFEVFELHKYLMSDDEGCWDLFSKAPLPFDQILQPVNLGMYFSSGEFPLYGVCSDYPKGQTERYSMALLFGEDREDLIKNKRTVQQIYNADYRFSKPPLKPNLKIYPGDGEVTLVWDDIAEKSFDPFLQEFDFEGYVIYKSTEAQFLENRVITDSYGNLTFRKPVTQFDLNDGKKGPHPIDIYGIKYNLGNDTGLKHTWIDTDVQNGQTYYYAIVSYDYGLVNYGPNSVEGIPPSECSVIIKTTPLGDVTFIDVNCGVATPRPAAAGYTPPEIEGDIDHIGPGTGHIEVQIVEKHKVLSGTTTYELEFNEETRHHTELFPCYSLKNVAKDEVILDSIKVDAYGIESQIFNGSILTIYNDTSITIDYNESRWLEGTSDYTVKTRLNKEWEKFNFMGTIYRLNINQPSDYVISFYDSIYTYTKSVYGLRSYPSNVGVYDITDSVEADYAIVNNDDDERYSHGDDIVIIVPDEKFTFKNYTSWMIRFESDFRIDTVAIDTTFQADTVFVSARIDTVWETVDPPESGDKYFLATTKPFRKGDVFRFTVNGADSSNAL
ncbi:MAG: hypothetical protein KAW56_03065, partial [Candidatus Marinimicrobia bacterium]|nr:hypothetical protein [Candidatus Neomarinimicrobiota bacterium]